MPSSHPEEHHWYPHLTVATVVERQGKFLMVEEIAEGNRVINQPAGHLDPDETLVEAAVRETYEETGWHVLPTAIVGFYLYRSPHNKVTYFRICFAADAKMHDPAATLDEGIIAAHWMSPDELGAASVPLRSPLVTDCIRDYQSGQRLPLSALSNAL